MGVMAHMLAIPEEDVEQFGKWIQLALEEGIANPAIAMRAVQAMMDYFRAHVAQRSKSPGDDLVSLLLESRVEGEKLPEAMLLGILRSLIVAGIDTAWSAIGASLWHLATHPADRTRLHAEPGLLESAVEEFLRAYSPVTMGRQVVQQTTLNGFTYQSGKMVLLSFPAANRDPEAFPDPDQVILDRAANRHVAFGIGIHRCIGAHLARMEMRVALQEWLRRIPDFHLADPAAVRWSAGQVRGPRVLPISFAPLPSPQSDA
jgi:cytochrome P450